MLQPFNLFYNRILSFVISIFFPSLIFLSNFFSLCLFLFCSFSFHFVHRYCWITPICTIGSQSFTSGLFSIGWQCHTAVTIRSSIVTWTPVSVLVFFKYYMSFLVYDDAVAYDRMRAVAAVASVRPWLWLVSCRNSIHNTQCSIGPGGIWFLRKCFQLNKF